MQWKENMRLADANVILRYLLNDSPELSESAHRAVEDGVYTKPEILAEVVYVLVGVYSASRDDVGEYVNAALDNIGCAEEKAVRYALDAFAATSLDFVDCLLAAYHIVNHENVVTFDRKLEKYIKSH